MILLNSWIVHWELLFKAKITYHFDISQGKHLLITNLSNEMERFMRYTEGKGDTKSKI